MSSCAANIAASGPVIAETHARHLGIAAALSAGHQRRPARTADHQRRRQRSTVRARAQRSLRGVADCVCAKLSVAIAVEDAPRVVQIAAASHRADRAMESREHRIDCPIAGVPLWAVVSGAENP